jgi:hypothetical protein
LTGHRAVVVTLLLAVAAGGVRAAELADPTRPYGGVSGPVTAMPEPVTVQWRLSMVRIAPDDRSAMLNGALVREGDTVAGARVVRIEAGAVVLDAGGRHETLALSGAVLKRPAGAREPARGGQRR